MGRWVFGLDGMFIKVVVLLLVFLVLDVYILVFDDGLTMRCSGDYLWMVECYIRCCVLGMGRWVYWELVMLVVKEIYWYSYSLDNWLFILVNELLNMLLVIVTGKQIGRAHV